MGILNCEMKQPTYSRTQQHWLKVAISFFSKIATQRKVASHCHSWHGYKIQTSHLFSQDSTSWVSPFTKQWIFAKLAIVPSKESPWHVDFPFAFDALVDLRKLSLPYPCLHMNALAMCAPRTIRCTHPRLGHFCRMYSIENLSHALLELLSAFRTCSLVK